MSREGVGVRGRGRGLCGSGVLAPAAGGLRGGELSWLAGGRCDAGCGAEGVRQWRAPLRARIGTLEGCRPPASSSVLIGVSVPGAPRGTSGYGVLRATQGADLGPRVAGDRCEAGCGAEGVRLWRARLRTRVGALGECRPSASSSVLIGVSVPEAPRGPSKYGVLRAADLRQCSRAVFAIAVLVAQTRLVVHLR